MAQAVQQVANLCQLSCLYCRMFCKPFVRRKPGMALLKPAHPEPVEGAPNMREFGLNDDYALTRRLS